MSATSTPPTDSEKQAFELKKDLDRARASADGFWQRVSEGIELQQLWAQFKAEARASYGLYSQEVDWKSVEKEKVLPKAWHVVRMFFWAMIMKLSPPRRVFLLLALVLILLGPVVYQSGEVSFSIHPRFWGIALLLLLFTMELADRVTMKRDLEIAREIQRWLVPDHPPEVPGLEIAFSTRPANTVAGDYYDVFFRGDEGTDSRRLLCVVADVAGKSVPAALLMATLQASLQALAAAPDSLVELVVKLNHYACAHSLGGMRFTTAFLAEFDPTSRKLEYVCAGHNAPILRRARGQIERLEAGGLPLGIDSAAPYECASVTLESGDLLLIFTDGLIEAFNEQGEEFGEARLLSTLSGLSPQSADATREALMRSVDAFVGTTRQHDDITCLLLRSV
ncbi:MAG TPA: PP2C family protein-serine/threonine phosphatase [Terriglobia bacterium]|jgi:sigma-B regulation protein RsbU (phosphoserine phosphatase)